MGLDADLNMKICIFQTMDPNNHAKQITKGKSRRRCLSARQSDEPELLIISARKFKNQWVFPVGSVENGETLEEAAMRECAEESGYVVDIGKKLAPIMVQGKQRSKRFTFFSIDRDRSIGSTGDGPAT